MKVLLDTNIIIHRESSTVIHEDIGILIRWLDRLKYEKCVHPVTISELEKHHSPNTVRTLKIKTQSYHVMRTTAPMASEVEIVCKKMDVNANDANDTILLNELYNGRVDLIITEDKKFLRKAQLLGLSSKCLSIDAFLESVSVDYPDLADYGVLSIEKKCFGDIDVHDQFFNSFRTDYQDFDAWFQRKADDDVYVSMDSFGKIAAMLYLKVEDRQENYSDISPALQKKTYLKIGTFKVTSNGFRLGERFMYIVFHNAIRLKAEGIYLTLFESTPERKRLIELIKTWGFSHHGQKDTSDGKEEVYVRNFERFADCNNPTSSYPYMNMSAKKFLAAIRPVYHTDLFPDSILKTENMSDYKASLPHRNAIEKVFISRSIERNLSPGNIVIFYRTKQEGKSAYYSSVITTIGIVREVSDGIKSLQEFKTLCRKRSVFSDIELERHWSENNKYRPFLVSFLYVCPLPKRMNLKDLIDNGIIASIYDAPRGFTAIDDQKFNRILEGSNANRRYIVD